MFGFAWGCAGCFFFFFFFFMGFVCFQSSDVNFQMVMDVPFQRMTLHLFAKMIFPQRFAKPAPPSAHLPTQNCVATMGWPRGAFASATRAFGKQRADEDVAALG